MEITKIEKIIYRTINISLLVGGVLVLTYGDVDRTDGIWSTHEKFGAGMFCAGILLPLLTAGIYKIFKK
jgi:hypothetical protein